MMTTYTPGESVKFVVDGDLDSDGGMLLNLDTGGFHGLNPTGARIWNRLSTGSTPAQIADELAAETGAERTRVSDDVNRLVRELIERGLIQPAGEHP